MSGCRSPYGERGLKCRGLFSQFAYTSRSPYGERGLKYCNTRIISHEVTRRSPYGERGLKWRNPRSADRSAHVALLTESVD